MKRASGRSELEVKPKHKTTTNRAPVRRALPDWYQPGPFLYDARIFMFSCVCLFVVLMLAGELLLTVLVLGTLVIHIIDNIGAKHQAVASYICVFVVAEFTVIYSAIPLLWISLYNVILIFALNAFVVFTGGWVLLHFDAFLQEEPSLAVFIETSLFTFYPGLCVIIMSWVVAEAVSAFLVPYAIILFGFISAQLFLPQHASSFHKSKTRQSTQNILSPVEVATVLTVYNLVPMQSFILLNFWSIFEPEVLLKLVFVIACPLFLTTLVDAHYVFEYFEISLKKKTTVRWITGIVSLTIIYIVIYLDDLISSGLMSWLPTLILANMLFGIFMSRKSPGRKIIIILLACACCVLYVTMISYILPTNLEAWGMITKIIGLLLTCNAVLTVACVIASVTSTKERLSDLLLCTVVLLVFTEHQFLSLGLYSHSMLTVTIAIECYTLSRLQNAGKVSWYVTWLSIGIHSTKLPVIIQSQLKVEYAHHMISSPIVDKFFVFLFILAISKLFFFESRKSVPLSYAVAYTFSIIVLSLLVMDSLLQPIFIMVYHTDFTTAGSLAMVLLTSGSLLLKLTFNHMTRFQDAKTLNIIWMLLGLFIFILQPSSDETFSNLCNLLLLVSFLGCLTVFLTRSSRSRPLYLDIIYSIVIGAPVGAKAFQLLINPEHIKIINLAIYLLSSGLATFILLSSFLWLPSLKSKNTSTAFLPSCTMLISILFVTVYIMESKWINNSQVYGSINGFYQKFSQPCIKFFVLIFLSVSIILKSLLRRIATDDPFGAIHPSSLPSAINLATIFTYLLLLINNPPDILPELWACICSIVFLLITKDNFIFSRIDKVKKPGLVFTVCVIVLYVATVYENIMWKDGLGLWGIVELLICVIISPVFYSVCFFVLHRFYVMPIKRCALLSPICIFLPLLGTSNASWMLGSLGLVSGLGSTYFASPYSSVIGN